MALFPSGIRLQAGVGIDGSILAKFGDQFSRAVGTNVFSLSQSFAQNAGAFSGTAKTGDFNHDGITDIVGVVNTNQVGIFYGNADGTFNAAITVSGLVANTTDIQVADLNGDGYDDFVTANVAGTFVLASINQKNNTFTNNTVSQGSNLPADAQVGDVNSDGIVDIVNRNAADSSFRVAIGNGDGTFKVGISYSGTGTGSENQLLVDINGDGNLDIIDGSNTINGIGVLYGNGNGSFKAFATLSTFAGANYAKAGDFNNDGKLDLIQYGSTGAFFLSGNGDGSFKARTTIPTSPVNTVSVGDINNDGYLDFAYGGAGGNSASYTLLGNGDGTFSAQQTVAGTNTSAVFLADLNRDGVLDLLGSASATAIGIYNAVTTKSSQEEALNLTTTANARSALDLLNKTSDRITLELSVIGSNQSRITTGISNLQNTRDTYAAAFSRITDVDIASESAQLVQANIKQQASSFILNQVNLLPQIALQILKG